MAATTRFLLNYSKLWLVLIGFAFAAAVTHFAQDQKADPEPKKKQAATPKKKKAAPKPALEALGFKGQPQILAEKGRQIDFPAMTADADGSCWIAFLEHDGVDDVVKLTKSGGETVEISERGIVHQPAIAADGDGIRVFWGEIGDGDVMNLLSRKTGGEIETVAASAGSDSFAHAGTDAKGRVWVAWQSMRNGQADVFAKFVTPEGEWSEEFAVATSQAGEWEPRLAFDPDGGAWVIFESSEGNEFNLHLAKIAGDGGIETWPIAHTPRYEARADIVATADGSGFWIAAERGRIRWGLDLRGHGNEKGLNAQKEILFGKFDIESKTFTEYPLGPAGEAGKPVNLPAIGLDSEGRPWVAYRYFERVLWRIAATRFDPETKTWTSRRRIADSPFGQDRRSSFAAGKEGLLFCWPTDLRKTKAAQTAEIRLATIDTAQQLPDAAPSGAPKDLSNEPFSPSQKTPERPADDRHVWKPAEAEYALFWGDFHRHTDVSNCRTGFDGCIAEHFRYAYDIGKLDFMGTSDHTDVGKFYHPYEWHHNQRMHDALHSPGQFNTLYVYEREQKWPWGHRNIVFADRGGPVVYINRTIYRNSPWQKQFPVNPGVGEIQPEELWKILQDYGKSVTAISHTGATGMGTDWAKYENPINLPQETVVEIFQGARVSYEGIGTPQPTVGLRPNESYTANSGANPPKPPAPIEDFGKYNPGVYQNALEIGHRLGVFASSDHISQHASYGGVYCEEFTREGIIEAISARRTVAATDKIYLEFTCNEQLLGSMFDSSTLPKLKFKVDGTAKLKRVTIVRNEKDWKVFDEFDGSSFEKEVTDEQPLPGENRYYLRVEQEDGNMAWASPIWVNVKIQ